MASVQEILDSICGKQDNSNLPRCATSVSTGLFIQKDDETRELMETNVVKPIISLERHNEFVVCDLFYISAYDQDLKDAYDVFELYGSNLNDIGVEEEIKEGELTVPYLVIALTALQGYDHVVTLSSPITWSLTSNKPGSMPNTIRILFKVEDVMFYEGQVLDEAKRVEDELAQKRLRTDISSSYYAQREEELKEEARKREENNNTN